MTRCTQSFDKTNTKNKNVKKQKNNEWNSFDSLKGINYTVQRKNNQEFDNIMVISQCKKPNKKKKHERELIKQKLKYIDLQHTLYIFYFTKMI